MPIGGLFDFFCLSEPPMSAIGTKQTSQQYP
jgi:hypothetical protein